MHTILKNLWACNHSCVVFKIQTSDLPQSLIFLLTRSAMSSQRGRAAAKPSGTSPFLLDCMLTLSFDSSVPA